MCAFANLNEGHGGVDSSIFVREAREIWDRARMKRERVRSLFSWVLASIVTGLSGCNGCQGCEGQTSEMPAESATIEASEPKIAEVEAPSPEGSAAPIASVAPNPEHDPTGVRRCCKAISDNVESAPDKHKTTWKTALAACNEAAEKNTGRKGLDAVREILTPVGWPVACQ